MCRCHLVFIYAKPIMGLPILISEQATGSDAKYVYADTHRAAETRMLDHIYITLYHLRLCANLDDFSSRWLGMEESYCRGLRSKGRTASARSIHRSRNYLLSRFGDTIDERFSMY
jgi:hypothetical protein